MRLKRAAVVLTFTLLITSITGCSVPGGKEDDTNSAEADTAGGEKVLKVVLDEPPTLDPQMANSMPSQTILYHLGAGLLRMEGGEVNPDGAESYDVSDDGLVYTFHLRDDLKWSDGEPMTAGDYEYGFKRLVDPNTASPFAFFGAIVKNGAEITAGKLSVDEYGVKVLDDKTLEITLQYAAPYFPSMLSNGSFAPARQDYVEKYGRDFSSTADKNVYSGPFKVKEWHPNEALILEKNDQYWDKSAVKLDELQIEFVKDRQTAFTMFETGEIDLTSVPTLSIAKYKDDPRLFQFHDGSVDYLKFNVNKSEVAANKNIRLAFAYAINVEEFAKLRGRGSLEAARRLVMPDVSGVEKTYGEEYPYEMCPPAGDEAKAKEYLEKGLQELGMKAEDVHLEYLADDSDGAKEGSEIIQERVKKVLGIDINIKLVPYEQVLEMVPKGEYEMTMSGWTPDYSDPYTYLELWVSDSAYNDSGYSNPEYDKYMKQSQELATEPKARLDAMFEAEKILLADAPCIPIDVRRATYIKSENIKDLDYYFTGYGFNFIRTDLK